MSVGAPSKSVAGNRYPLVIVLAAVSLGIVFDRAAWPLAPQSFGVWWCVSIAALGSWYVLWRNHNHAPAMAALAISLAAAGGAWHHALGFVRRRRPGSLRIGSQPPICLEAIALSATREIPVPPFTPLQPVRPEAKQMLEATAVRDVIERLGRDSASRMIREI